MQTIKIQKTTSQTMRAQKRSKHVAVLSFTYIYRESKYVHDKFWFPIIKVFVKNSAKL